MLASWTKSCRQFLARASEASEADVERGREIAMRAAAFDTGAIEGLYPTNRGLTFSVAEQSAAWEQQVDAQGSDARALFEAQLRAFELVLDHVTERVPQITQAWIRRLHEETTAAQETYLVHTPVGEQRHPLPRGKYKEHPNHVRTATGGVHAYAPVDQTQAEMQRLLDELNTSEFEEAHPVIQASYAHYAFVAIHPFADGNGRVARAVASVYTYRAASVPLLILNEQRDAYFEALAMADAGDPRPFVEFIASASGEAVELAHDSLRTAQAPQPGDILQKFDELNRVDQRSQERNQTAVELSKWLHDVVGAQIEALGASNSVKISTDFMAGPKGPAPKGYRKIPGQGNRSIRITATTLTPKKVNLYTRINLFLSDDPRSAGRLLLKASKPANDAVVLDLSELWPSPSSLAQHRVENFVRRVLGAGLQALHDHTVGQVEG
jgi:Fic family protein